MILNSDCSRHAAPLFLLLPLLLGIPGVGAADDGGAERSLRQVAGILDYVGSDYAGAVSEQGVILDEGEYQEQLALTREAIQLAQEAGLSGEDTVVAGLRDLLETVEAVPPPDRILEASRGVRAALVRGHGLVLEPRAVPDAERARSLYVSEKCNECHGDRGGADTQRARELTPPPADFLDPGRVAGVSPHRALHAITFGVDDTGMASYDYLSAADRWSLAFWVLSLRHAEADVERGERVLSRAGDPLAPTARRLSQLSEDDIRSAIAGAVPAPEDREAAVAFLRARAPFLHAEGTRTFDGARALLDRGVAAYRSGDLAAARQALVSAYLDGVEPHESGLAARNPALLRQVEQGMLDLRAAASRGVPPDELAARATAVAALLDRAEEGRLEGTAAFLASLAIALREGFEAALLVAALLGLVRRRGVPEHARNVHVGWALALFAGIATWVVARKLLSGLHREMVEGIVALTAATVLLLVTHWSLGQATSRQFMGFLARGIGAGEVGRAGALGIAALAFVAVYREAFEVILFYEALLLDAAEHVRAILAGAAAGLVALLAIVALLRRVGRRLDARRFFLATSGVLAILAVVLLGKGIHALQEAAVLPLTRLGTAELPALGIHASTEVIGAQLVLLLLLLGSAWWTSRSARASRAEGDGDPVPA